MTKTQENKLSMATAVDAVLTRYQSTWETLPAFAEAVALFRNERNLIDPEAQKQLAKTEPAGDSKDSKREAAVKLAFQMAANIRAFGLRTNNTKLAGDMNFAESSLRRMRDNVLPGTVRNILDTAQQHKAPLTGFGVSDNSLAALEAALSGYKAENGEPRAVVVGKSVATVNVAAHLTLMMDELEILDSLVGNFKEDAPDFVQAYNRARVIIDLRGRSKQPHAGQAS